MNRKKLDCLNVFMHYSNAFIILHHFTYNIIGTAIKSESFKVEEWNEPSCEALIFTYGVVLFNIFSTICI